MIAMYLASGQRLAKVVYSLTSLVFGFPNGYSSEVYGVCCKCLNWAYGLLFLFTFHFNADQKLRNLLAFNIMNCYANFTFKQDFPCSSDNMSACIDIFVKRHGEEVQEMYKHLERLIQVDNLCVAVQVCVHVCVCVHVASGYLILLFHVCYPLVVTVALSAARPVASWNGPPPGAVAAVISCSSWQTCRSCESTDTTQPATEKCREESGENFTYRT